MSEDFPYLRVPEELKLIVGSPDEGTRTYRREGSHEEVGAWYDAISSQFPDEGFISPGGVSMFAQVSRAAVHKRLKEGKMTAFCFHVVENKRSLFGYDKKLKQLPYVYVVQSEAKAWGQELKTRPDRREAMVEAAGGSKPDWNGDFLDKDPKDIGKKSVKYEHEQINLDDLKLVIEILVTEAIERILPEKVRKKREQARIDQAFGRGKPKRKSDES